MVIRCKADAYALAATGALGNHTRRYPDGPDSVPMEDRSAILFGVRTMVPGGPGFKTDLPWAEAAELYWSLGPGAKFYESLPLGWARLNAEVCRDVRGPEMRYLLGPGYCCRDVNGPGTKHAHGLEAHMLLTGYLGRDDRDWLDELLDTYDHPIHRTTVELSVADRPVGTHHSPTVFWELRHF